MEVAADPGPSTEQPTVDRSLALRLLLASVLGIAAAVLCYVLMLRTSLGQRFDYSAHIGSYPINPAVLEGKALGRITAPSFAVALVVLIVIGVVRHRPLLGVGAAVAAGVAVAVTDVLKDDVLTRPFITRQVPLAANTFPSGHTAAAMACAMALMLVSPPRWRSLVAIVAGAYGWLTAVQSQTTSAHYPSDVIGSIFLTFAAVAGVAGLLAWFRPVRWAGHRYYGLSQAALGVLAALSVAVSVWGMAKVLSRLGSRAIPHNPAAGTNYDAFITGVSLSVALGVVAVMVLLALLGDADLG